MSSLVKGVEIENEAKERELKNTHARSTESCFGIMGSGCWNRLKSHHKDRIVSKKGENFELDRDNWTAQANFKLTRDDVRAEMVEVNIAVYFDEPVWMDSNGHICNEKDYVVFMVSPNTTHPDHFIVAGEIGGGIRQKGDRHTRGTRLC